MSSEYLATLQISHVGAGSALEKARRQSVARYERLTSRGPLRWYRKSLLADVERACRALQRSESETQPEVVHRTKSVLARRAAGMDRSVDDKVPMKNGITDGSILKDDLTILKGRTISYLRAKADRSDRAVAVAEDEFCRTVMHRLEGELIRYSSRQELLQIAAEDGIGQFRANMLIAQITEAVRQNKLYQLSAKEIAAVGNKKRAGGKVLVVLGIIAAVVVADLLLVRYLF